MTPTTELVRPRGRVDLGLWVRRGSALIVSAYASYEHQREFAVEGGADPPSAALWPLSVDGLVRHEALEDRAEVRGLRRRVVAAAWLKRGAA